MVRVMIFSANDERVFKFVERRRAMTSPAWYWLDVIKCFNGIDNQRNEDNALEGEVP